MNNYKKNKILFLISSISTILGFIFVVILVESYKVNYSSNSDFVIFESGEKIYIKLIKQASKRYLLNAKVYKDNTFIQTNSWPLNYEVFRVDTGDVNNDKSTNILVGVIKPTRFDPVTRKRLFIFKLVDGYIRPLWLGSRVSQPLVDFHYYKINSEGIIRTMELEKDNTFLIAEYQWQGFGLAFIHYLAREISFKQAIQILNNNKYEIKI